MELEGKNVLVTGSAKRVGKEIALELARHGANITVHYRNSKSEAEQTRKEIELLGVSAITVRGELSDWKQAQKVVQEASRKLGGLDVLVNSASTFYPTPFLSSSEAQFDELLSSNLKSVFACSQQAAREMSRNKEGGKIVNIADWAALKPYSGYSPYLSAKAGVVALTAAMAKELAPKILVNAVAPGPILPPEKMGEKSLKAAQNATLVGRWGGPEAVTRAVVFLLEDDFITGQTVVVDGGRMLK